MPSAGLGMSRSKMLSSSGSPAPVSAETKQTGIRWPLAQGLLKRVVELLRRHVRALLEVQRHQALVQLDDLVDDPGVSRLDGGKIGRAVHGLEKNNRPRRYPRLRAD